MSVVFMLAILWWGFIGFLGFCLGIWYIVQTAKDSHWGSDRRAGLANLKHRDRWLLEFFGEEGRLRWLANERARKARQPWDNGHKVVDDTQRPLDEYSWNPPWGDDDEEYNVRHYPRPSDWLAAGFWEPFVDRSGKAHDPMKELLAYLVRGFQTDGHVVVSLYVGGEELVDTAMKQAKEIEAAGGPRARYFGMPGENGGRRRTEWAGISKEPYVPRTGCGLGRRSPS